jgi:hypothetical protein
MALYEEGSPSGSEAIPKEFSDFQIIHDLKDVSGLSAEEIDREILKTRNDEKHPFNAAGHRFHNAAVLRMEKLYQKKYPEKTPEEKEKETEAEFQKLKAEADDQREKIAEEKATQELERTKTHLKAHWGSDFEANLSLAKRTVSDFASEEQRDFLDESGLGNDPEFIDLVQKLGRMLESKNRKGR